jgi:GntR family transcriptional regulator, carbon starvation induced regulator
VADAQGKHRSTEVYEAICRDILDGRFEPRARLRMDLLSVALGASLGAVREALVRLTADGLLVADPPKGFVVAPISRLDLSDLTETRVELETRCLRQAIRHGDIAWEGRVIGALHELVRTPIHFGPNALSAEWSRTHKAFHDALVSACDSRWRMRLREQLFLHAERYRRLSVPYRLGLRDVDSEHAAIAEASLARNEDVAVEMLAEHLRRTADLLCASAAPFEDEIDRTDAPTAGSEFRSRLAAAG